MKLMFLSLLSAQLWGLSKAFDIPSFMRLTVDSETITKGTWIFPDSQTLVIRGYSRRGNFDLEINLDTLQICSSNWSNLTGKFNYGSGELGLLAISVPTIIISAPLWIPLNIMMSFLFERFGGMDRHDYFIWKKLNKQLSSSSSKILLKALRKKILFKDHMLDDIPFKTTQKELNQIPNISKQMIVDGIDSNLVKCISEIASFDQGMFDLMLLWYEGDGYSSREEILQDIILNVKDYKGE